MRVRVCAGVVCGVGGEGEQEQDAGQPLPISPTDLIQKVVLNEQASLTSPAEQSIQSGTPVSPALGSEGMQVFLRRRLRIL